MLLLGAPRPAAGEGEPGLPYHRFQLQELAYAGPVEDDPDLAELEEIAVGWFGPGDAAHPVHGDLWVAASMAVEEANRAGGYAGRPFRLRARWSESPWAAGAAELARLAYEERVWAILGSVDGAATHLAEQVVAKARLPLVNPVSTDASVNLAGVPWMFSLAPSDPLWAPVLITRLIAEVGERDFVLLAATDHDSRLATEALLAALAARGRGPRRRADLDPGGSVPRRKLTPWIRPRPAAVLVVADGRFSARLVRGLRDAGFAGPVFGTPQMGRTIFRRQAGPAAGALRYPELLGPGDRREVFAAEFRRRQGHEPDWAAAQAYDAARLLIAAITRAGPNRARIRTAIAELSPWPGVAGEVVWDAMGQNRRPVETVRVLP